MKVARRLIAFVRTPEEFDTGETSVAPDPRAFVGSGWPFALVVQQVRGMSSDHLRGGQFSGIRRRGRTDSRRSHVICSIHSPMVRFAVRIPGMARASRGRKNASGGPNSGVFRKQSELIDLLADR